MPKIKRKKDGFSYFKLAVALIFLINPCIRTIDLFADFVATIIIAKMLSPYCDRAPKFTEAKAAFVKLGWLSVLKIPAFIVMVIARSNNTTDTAIITLFSFVFAIFEAYYIIIGIKNLFEALFHVGLRGGADAVITPFPIFGQALKIKPELLRLLTYIFAVIKSASGALPEMILLTTADPLGDPEVIYKARTMYPVFARNGFIITSIFGIVIACLFFCYILAIRRGGGIHGAVSALYGEGELLEIEEYIHAKSLKRRVKLLLVAGFFTFDFAFDSTGGIDILPNFMYGIFLFIAVCKLFDDGGAKTVAKCFSAIYTTLSLICYILTIDFLSVYSFTSLVKKAAKDAFLPVLFTSGIEFFALCVTLVCLGIFLCKFTRSHTSAAGDLTSRLTAVNRKKMTVKTIVFSSLGIFCGLTKFLSLLFKYFQTTTSVEIKNSIEIINTSLLPWFDSFGTFVCIVFVGYGCYYFTVLCDEIEMKYL